jgi:hypothetical protein
MNHVDERILERLEEWDEPLTPFLIADDLGVDDRFVRHRCQVLAHAGFLEVVERDEDEKQLPEQFTISSWGELYLDGEVDAQHRQPSPAPRPPDKVRPGWFAGFG